jgi:hypothetical protein
MQRRLTSVIGFALAAFAAIPCFAQDPLDETYGHAVHEYFRGNVERAEELLNDVIAAGSLDPRAYYFRGLCAAAMSGQDAGLADFQQAAQLEIDGKKVVNVGKALERIQGCVRCQIENVRRQTRLASRGRYLEMQRQRYEESLRSAPNSIQPRRGDVPPPMVPNANDPFRDGPDLNRGNPIPMPEEINKVPPATDDPFGGNSNDATTKPNANDDPFGGGANNPPPATDDPFGN